MSYKDIMINYLGEYREDHRLIIKAREKAHKALEGKKYSSPMDIAFVEGFIQGYVGSHFEILLNLILMDSVKEDLIMKAVGIEKDEFEIIKRIAKSKLAMVKKLLNKHLSTETIADIVGWDEEVIKKIDEQE